MLQILLFLIFLIFQSPILFARTDQTNPDHGQQSQMEEGFQDLRPQSTNQRINEIERTLHQLQQQIDRLSSTVNQDRQEFSYMSQNVNSLKRNVDGMKNDIDDLKSEQRDITRRLGR